LDAANGTTLRIGKRGRPSSREAILDAAEEIVMESGAGHLTFESLAERTGISRGGLLYNFPSKDALLQAMVQRHVEQRRAMEDEFRRSLPPGPDLSIRSFIDASLREPLDSQCAGSMLAAAAANPSLLEPVRRAHAALTCDVRADSDDPIRAFMALAALDGLFYQEVFGLSALTDDEKGAVMRRIRAVFSD
jgi:AcrR family transcriptional regulator